MSDAQANKVVLITGAAKRIGAAITSKFHGQGYNVILHCNRSLDEASRLADQLNQQRRGSAQIVQADLTRDEEVEELAAKAMQCFNRLDVLINNASTYYPTPLGEATAKDWDDLVNSNVRGAFFLSQSLAEAVTRQRGSIVNLIDIYAEQPRAEHPVYCIAKAGLLAMTRSLAVDLAPHVRVNGVAPGAILWAEQDHHTDSDTLQQAILDSVPLRRMGRVEDIAEAVYFLAAEAGYVTGEVIRVDGGRRLNL